MKTYHQFIKINEAIAGNVCPVATLEPSVNSANKANAVQNYLYGPVNTQDKKMVEIYWTELANELNMSPDVVETARCSSCVYNNRSTEVSDCIIQGMGGFMSVTGEADDFPGASPQKAGVAIADIFTGMYATTAILAAVVHRDQTGHGQYIDMALLDTQIAVMANVSSAYLCSDKVPRRWGNASPIIVPYQTFPTSDGWMIVAVGNDGQFKHFVTAGGEAHLAENPLYINNPLRVENRKSLISLLEVMTRRKTKAEWISLLEAANVPCGPINNFEEVFDNEQVKARGVQINVPHPTAGNMKLVASPMRLSETPVEVRMAPPTLGQHTDEILQERLSLDSNAIAALQEKGII
mgnify:CR=1 FL=1